MSSNLPASPITGTNNVTVFDTIKTSDIVRLYREQEKIDVSRFFIGVDEVSILECGDTLYRFYYPFTIVGDESFYQELVFLASNRGLEYDRDWSDDHELALRAISENERVLEIGCNTGKFLERVREKTNYVAGLEFNSEAAAVAQAKGLDVRNLDIAILAENEPASFDTICAFQVLEHIPNAGEFIQNCLKALRPGGKLIFSVPNNEPYFQRFSKYEVLNMPPHHMGLWNHYSFQNLTRFFDMTLEKSYPTGQISLSGDAYLRAKYFANIKSLPKRESPAEKLKMISVLPFAMIRSGADRLLGKKGFGHITVVFRRR